MIKKCKILLDNPAVTVVDFDGRKVQLPHTESTYIKYENGKYSVSTKEEYGAEQAAQEAEQKKVVRATTKKKKATTKNPVNSAETAANGEET